MPFALGWKFESLTPHTLAGDQGLLIAVVAGLALLFVGQHDFNTALKAAPISFFPITVSVGIGLPTLDPEYCNTLGALTVSVTLAFIGTNLVGIVTPHNRGLGALFLAGQTNSSHPLMFAV